MIYTVAEENITFAAGSGPHAASKRNVRRWQRPRRNNDGARAPPQRHVPNAYGRWAGNCADKLLAARPGGCETVDGLIVRPDARRYLKVGLCDSGPRHKGSGYARARRRRQALQRQPVNHCLVEAPWQPLMAVAAGGWGISIALPCWLQPRRASPPCSSPPSLRAASRTRAREAKAGAIGFAFCGSGGGWRAAGARSTVVVGWCCVPCHRRQGGATRRAARRAAARGGGMVDRRHVRVCDDDRDVGPSDSLPPQVRIEKTVSALRRTAFGPSNPRTHGAGGKPPGARKVHIQHQSFKASPRTGRVRSAQCRPCSSSVPRCSCTARPQDPLTPPP